MKHLRSLLVSISFAAAFLMTVGGCGTPENTVIAPAELTPEQQAEMSQLGEQMKEEMSRSPSKTGN